MLTGLSFQKLQRNGVFSQTWREHVVVIPHPTLICCCWSVEARVSWPPWTKIATFSIRHVVKQSSRCIAFFLSCINIAKWRNNFMALVPVIYWSSVLCTTSQSAMHFWEETDKPWLLLSLILPDQARISVPSRRPSCRSSFHWPLDFLWSMSLKLLQKTMTWYAQDWKSNPIITCLFYRVQSTENVFMMFRRFINGEVVFLRYELDAVIPSPAVILLWLELVSNLDC